MAAHEHRREIDDLLTEVKELYTRICRLLPQGFRAEDIATSDKQEIVTAIHRLLLASRRIDGVLKAASLNGLPQPVNTELLRFYREELIPDKTRLQNFFLEWIGLPNIEIDLSKVEPKREEAPIWHILVSGLDYWKLDESGEFAAEDLDAAERLLFSSFFEPDQWMRNSEELHPVAGERADLVLPSNIRVRVRELYRSFILGNFLAAIALTRAMLEYAVVEHASRHGINAFFIDQNGRRRTRRLRDLVNELSENIPNLKSPMETIIESGNRTLHPELQDRLVIAPDRLHDVALESINAIRAVVEHLYLRHESNA